MITSLCTRPCRAVLAALALATASTAIAQTPFTYQGKLENSGAPYNGTAALRVSLWTAASGGALIRSETLANVTVSNGLFTAAPATFIASDFANAAGVWLEIEVSTNGGAAYTKLTPRQRVTYAPLALRAATADTLSGSLTLPNPNTLSFGSTTRQMLNLWSTQYGLGVQTDTLYQRSNNNFAWFRGGSHHDGASNPGSGGSAVMTLAGNGYLEVRGTNAGFGLLNRSDPTKAWVAYVDGAANSYRLWNNAVGDRITVQQNGDTSISGKITTPGLSAAADNNANGNIVSGVQFTSSGTGAGVYGATGSVSGYAVLGQGADNGYGGRFISNGANGWAVNGVSDTGFAGYFQGKLHATSAATLGSTLNVSGSATFNNTVTSQGSTGGFYVQNRNAPAKTWAMYSRNLPLFNANQLAFWSNATGDVATLTEGGNMFLNGSLSTTVLTIRGGADVAEPFEMTKPDEMEPGCVVVIDKDNPGKLKLSAEKYDKRVAGIISGAGGVQPGLRLHQEGVMEGDHHVALTGRVYVKADASHGPIEPGDLLTTSDTPGHAMKVSHHSTAQGAILGKAMSTLDRGTGLVLVLVTLQ